MEKFEMVALGKFVRMSDLEDKTVVSDSGSQVWSSKPLSD